MKYYEINETAARTAKQAYSFFEYEAGSMTREYRAAVDRCYEIVESLPDDLKEKGAVMADRYARRLADWYNKKFRIDMMCPSIMVAGGSNFPVAKKQKQNAAIDRHFAEYQEIAEIPKKIDALRYGNDVIKAGDPDAIERLKAKLAAAEALQAKMKEMNAYYRKHKTVKGYGDLTDDQAAELDRKIKRDLLYKVPFAPYELTNNNAKIKSTKARIAQLERLKNSAETAETSAAGEYDTDLFRVEENAEIMRLQLFFDGKPDEQTRTLLKKNGFRWSPSNLAWQRQLTDNAKWAVKRIIEELGR